MNRFFERIAGKAKDPAQPPVLIVAFGDSVTQGVMEHRRLDSSAVFHRIVQGRLEGHFPATTFSTINAGVAGDNVARALQRLERDVIRHQPDLVFVAFGLNDSLGGTEGLRTFTLGLEDIISRIRRETEADILLLTPPFMATRRGGKIHPEHQEHADEIIGAQTSGALMEYASAIREIGLRHNATVADVHEEWTQLSDRGLDTDLWLVNGLNHPGPDGHLLAASIVFHELLAARKQPSPAAIVRPPAPPN